MIGSTTLAGKRSRLVALGFTFALAAAFWAPAARAQGTLLDVAERDPSKGGGVAVPPSTISITSEGGYRWSKTEHLSLNTAEGKCSVTVERIGYNGKTQGPTTVDITQAQYDAAVAVLRANDALNQKDDISLKATARDLSDYDVTVTLDGKTASFHVYGPQLLHNAETKIVDALEGLTYKAVPSPR